MKSINNLILRALTATLLIGCGNESYKETIQNIPKKNKDLNIYIKKNQLNVMTIIPSDDNPVNYSLTGADSSYFNLNPITGEVFFKSKPTDIKNVYYIALVATNSSDNYNIQNIIVNIHDIEVLNINYPFFINDSNVNVDENQTYALTIIAIDDSRITYTLSGVDQSFFSLDPISGVITFKVAPDYEIKNTYSIKVGAINNSNNISYQDIMININDVNEYDSQFPIPKVTKDKKIYITLNPPTNFNDIDIINYEWNPKMTFFSELTLFIKTNFFNESLNETSQTKDTISKNIFNETVDILPMREVGNFKSISLSTIEDITTTTLDIGSNLFFTITNNLNRNFIVDEFKIVCYKNNYPDIIISTKDKALLSSGTLDSLEFITLGYTLTKKQECNYWVGTYVLTDLKTNETFTNSYTWNGTIY